MPLNMTIIFGFYQGTAIRERIQEQLRGQQFRGLMYHDEDDDELYDDFEEEYSSVEGKK